MPSVELPLAAAISKFATAHERGMLAVAKSLDGVAKALRDLGTGNASTQMGAIEFLATCVKDSGDAVSSSIGSVAEALERKQE